MRCTSNVFVHQLSSMAVQSVRNLGDKRASKKFPIGIPIKRKFYNPLKKNIYENIRNLMPYMICICIFIRILLYILYLYSYFVVLFRSGPLETLNRIKWGCKTARHTLIIIGKLIRIESKHDFDSLNCLL